MFGFPISLLTLMYKGMSLGFSAGLLIDTMAFKGALVVLTSMAPQNLLILPAFIAAATAAQNYALMRYSARRAAGAGAGTGRPHSIKKSPARLPSSYLFLYALLAVVIGLGCLIEGLLFPVVV